MYRRYTDEQRTSAVAKRENFRTWVLNVERKSAFGEIISQNGEKCATAKISHRGDGNFTAGKRAKEVFSNREIRFSLGLPLSILFHNAGE